MGDHRFTFKAEFSMHGVKESINLDWLNWGGGSHDIDPRIVDWICDVRDKAMVRYQLETEAYFAEQRKAEVEKIEREQLARLKAKYEVPSPVDYTQQAYLSPFC